MINMKRYFALFAALGLVASILGCPTKTGISEIDEPSSRVGAFSPAPTGTGFYHVTNGVKDAASKKVVLTNSADVAVPSTANGIITSSGTVLQQASDVLAGSSYLSIGASPSADGYLRLPTTSSANSGSYSVFSTSAGALQLGYDAATSRPSAIYLAASGTVSFGVNGIIATTDVYTLRSSVPVIGGSATSYGAHGYKLVSTAGNITLGSGSTEYQMMEFNTASGVRTITFPRAADGLSAYWKDLYNHTAYSMYISNGGGTPITMVSGDFGHYWLHDDVVEKWW